MYFSSCIFSYLGSLIVFVCFTGILFLEFVCVFVFSCVKKNEFSSDINPGSFGMRCGGGGLYLKSG